LRVQFLRGVVGQAQRVWSVFLASQIALAACSNDIRAPIVRRDSTMTQSKKDVVWIVLMLTLDGLM